MRSLFPDLGPKLVTKSAQEFCNTIFGEINRDLPESSDPPSVLEIVHYKEKVGAIHALNVSDQTSLTSNDIE
jgi:hypothetical protein